MSARHTHRKDTTQDAIVLGLRQVGAGVTSMTSLGGGVADLLVSFRARWFVLEAKSPGGKVRDSQWAWIGEQRAEVHVVDSVEAALEAIGAVQLARETTR